MYAALSRKELAGKRWDADAFFANGRAEIADVMAYVAGLGVNLQRGRALDFGCAIGRLTQALGAQFDEAVGVDIAAVMHLHDVLVPQRGRDVGLPVEPLPVLTVGADGCREHLQCVIARQPGMLGQIDLAHTTGAE